MKKDSVNVFSEGLNYDLNPLTTPNNVLTDCVNGTFITFNGDELALQADAGNTKIPYRFIQTELLAMWTLDQAETINPTFNWLDLVVEHNEITSFVTYTENTFQFVYLSIPQDTILTLYNELDIMIYDSTIPDSDPNQLFYLQGTMVTPLGTTHNVYRKKDQFNTNNPVLFKIKVFIENVEELIPISEYVKLSEGFLPLGMKEEGGVLYIISGRKPVDNIVKWEEGKTYSVGNIVYNDTLIKTYYESLVGGNSKALPPETNDYWKVIGTFEDYNNYLGEVEIGSYPAPEFSGLTGVKAENLLKYVETNAEIGTINQQLYNYRTINDEFFKTSRYVIFEDTIVGLITGGELGTFNVTGYDWDVNSAVKVPKFYIIKLYHQLNNGYLDITQDIWNKYINFRKDSLDTEQYWFKDGSFFYYCPNQYKGKLAMSIEIEEIQKFELIGIPTISYIAPNYKLSIKVKAQGNLPIGINPTMEINNIYVTTTIAGATSVYSAAIAVTGNEATYELLIPEANRDKIIEYRIVPQFSYAGLVIGTNNTTTGQYNTFLPKQYLDKYIIEGRRIINSEDDYKFKVLTSVCDLSNSYRKDTIVALTDVNGDYINTELAFPTPANPYFFALNTVLVGDYPTGTLMGTYTIVDGYPVVTWTVAATDYTPGIEYVFETQKVYKYDSTCEGFILTMYFDIGLILCSGTIIRVTQAGVTTIYTPETAPTLNAIEFDLVPNYQVTVLVTRPGFENISDSFFPTSDVTRNYAFIAKVTAHYEVTGNLTKPYRHFLKWEGDPTGIAPTMPNITTLNYSYYKKGESPATTTLALIKGIKQYMDFDPYCGYESNKVNVYNNTFAVEDSMTLLGYDPLLTIYNNIPNPSLYGTLPATISNCPVGCADGTSPTTADIIFKRELDPEDMLGESPGGFYIIINMYYSAISQGYGNGMAGYVTVDNASYQINQGFPQTAIFQHGPLVDGTYSISTAALVAYVNGVAVDSDITYEVSPGHLESAYQFNVTVSGADEEVNIYVDPGVVLPPN